MSSPVRRWICSSYHYVRGRVQKFPAWHTKAAPNGKCCEGYIAPSMVRLMYQFQAATCSSMLEALVLMLVGRFISVNFKSWSGRRILDPTTYMCVCTYIYIYMHTHTHTHTHTHQQMISYNDIKTCGKSKSFGLFWSSARRYLTKMIIIMFMKG